MILVSSKKLTKNEEFLMNLFWELNRPLTSVDLYDYTQDWKNGYLHNLLRALVEKDMLVTVGTVQYGRQYARQFVPAMTKEQYAAKLALSMGFEKEAVPRIALALVQEVSEGNSEEVIRELERIIGEIKENSPME